MKGPLVYLDYDQAELDAAYDQNVYAPNREQINVRNLANSDRARARIGNPRQVAYGTAEREVIDVYPAPAAGAPIFVFIHGGAWRRTGIDRYGFAAETFVRAGVTFAAVQFEGVDHNGGQLAPIVDQVRRAVAWIYRNARDLGADPGRIVLGGHSSGAHLASTVVITDWAAYGVPGTILHAALLCSGMYDLEPVRLSQRSSYVHFDDALVDAFSARRHIDRIGIPLVVAVGTHETPEFQRQARDFVADLEAAGKPVRAIVAAGYNHFELIETIGNPYGLIGDAALGLLDLVATG